MTKNHQIIYIPGIGDHNDHGQKRILRTWIRSGIKAHYLEIGWADGEAFESKLKRTVKLVDELYKQNGQISLVGVSAGAGAAINVYMKRPEKISGIVFVCGKILDTKHVNPRYYMKNPAFRQSLQLTQQNLEKLTQKDKNKMLSLHAIYDNVVYTKYSKIQGVASRTLFSIFHVPTIFLAITIYQILIINFLKRRSAQI